MVTSPNASFALLTARFSSMLVRLRWHVHGAHFGQALARRSRFCRRTQRQRVFSGDGAQDGTDRCTDPAQHPSVCLLQVQYVSHHGLYGKIRTQYLVATAVLQWQDRREQARRALRGANPH